MKTIIIDGIEYNLTPKVLFKKGDFVVIQETTYLISKIEGLNVTLSCNGRDCLFDIDVLKSARLWDITKDAKDGDVLATDSWLYIFKYTNNKALIQFHCTCPINGRPYKWCFSSDSDDSYLDIYVDANIHPATKEQRDLLFQKMKEAGYKWDAEKKELKKIEYETEIPFGAKDSELQEVTYFIPKGFHAEIDDDKVVIKKGEKPAEWSEEDEAKLKSILFHIEDVENKNVINWFKSLKNRVGCEVNCITTKEWSEEDKHILNNIYDFVAENLLDRNKGVCADECLKWLKSIKDRYTWKPSEEQMKALNYVVNLMASSESPNENDYYYNVFKDLRKQLKKLREE